MVSMLGSNVLPLSAVLGSGSRADRVGVPVAKSQAIYAQFEHVYGVPSEGGVRVDRIKILNTLIDQVASIKRDSARKNDPGDKLGAELRGQSPERLDALIEQYSQEIKTASKANPMPYRPHASLPTAIAVDILV